MKTQALRSAKEMKQNCETVSQIMKTLAHPQRLMLLCHLSSGEKTVGDLEALCEISQSQVSQFLSRMKLEGLISSEKRGQFVYYWISEQKTKKLIKALYSIFCV
jgi:DNA-binding transcriptional ArsR family regulator